MFGGGRGGGGLDPSKMKQMMEQMGIDIEEIDAEEVVIRTAKDEFVFSDPDVQRMDAQGQQTYQIVGSPETRDRGGDAGTTAEVTEDDDAGGSTIPQEDVELVAGRTGVTEDRAREALEAEDGDLAAAVERLE